MNIYKPERLIYTFEHGTYAVDVWKEETGWHTSATQVDAKSAYASFIMDENKEKAINLAIEDVKKENNK